MMKHLENIETHCGMLWGDDVGVLLTQALPRNQVSSQVDCGMLQARP